MRASCLCGVSADVWLRCVPPQIDSVQEMSLTANQPLSNVHRLTVSVGRLGCCEGYQEAHTVASSFGCYVGQWKTDSEEEQSQREVHPTGPPGSITLGPMQIRTFELTLK